jgi:predicted transcriptional regulator
MSARNHALTLPQSAGTVSITPVLRKAVMAVSLRVPEGMKQRIAKLVVARETNAHAFMLEAIREKLDAEEAQAAFHSEAQRRLSRMKKTGKAIPADQVFEYLRARVRGEPVKRPKARRLP